MLENVENSWIHKENGHINYIEYGMISDNVNDIDWRSISGSKSIGLKLGIEPSHKTTFPFGWSSTKLSDFLFARLNSTQPGNSIIGVPKLRLTGGAWGVE